MIDGLFFTMKWKKPERGLDRLRVRLIESAPRPPSTLIERFATDILEREGGMSFKDLIKKVAREVYFDELRRGAALVDIGLFGLELFIPDVAREIEARDGELWKIE